MRQSGYYPSKFGAKKHPGSDEQLGACPRIGLVLRESGFEIVFAVFS
ncbi:MAG: hypothetical protein ACI9FJ_002337, partial [Alteromonadaceae bacterium]